MVHEKFLQNQFFEINYVFKSKLYIVNYCRSSHMKHDTLHYAIADQEHVPLNVNGR